jgi:ABC-type phosphate/phosphonate transport system substrate-binding protein
MNSGPRPTAPDHLDPSQVLLQARVDGTDRELPLAVRCEETLIMGSDEKVIAAVLFGSAHAGSVYGGALAAAKIKGLPTFDLEVLATTDPIPHDAIAIRVDLEAAVARQIQAALVDLNKSPSGRVLIVRNGKTLTGYIPADDSFFAVVRRASKIGGI